MSAGRAAMRYLVLLTALPLAQVLGACVEEDFIPEYYSADPFALGVLDGLRRVDDMKRDLDARADLSAERRLELLEERIAVEIAAVNAAIEDGRPVAAEGGDR